MRTVEFKMERPGLVSPDDKVKIIEREGTSSYSYIIDPAVAMSGCFAARDRIKSEYGIVKDVRENARGFYVIVDFDEDYPKGTIFTSSDFVSEGFVCILFPGASVPKIVSCLGVRTEVPGVSAGWFGFFTGAAVVSAGDI